MKPSSFRMWRKRVQEENKACKKRNFDYAESGFKCSRQNILVEIKYQSDHE